MSEEKLGILEHTPYVHRVIICIDEDKQNKIWNTYTEKGRKEMGMKKCKVIVKEL